MSFNFSTRNNSPTRRSNSSSFLSATNTQTDTESAIENPFDMDVDMGTTYENPTLLENTLEDVAETGLSRRGIGPQDTVPKSERTRKRDSTFNYGYRRSWQQSTGESSATRYAHAVHPEFAGTPFEIGHGIEGRNVDYNPVANTPDNLAAETKAVNRGKIQFDAMAVTLAGQSGIEPFNVATNNSFAVTSDTPFFAESSRVEFGIRTEDAYYRLHRTDLTPSMSRTEIRQARESYRQESQEAFDQLTATLSPFPLSERPELTGASLRLLHMKYSQSDDNPVTFMR